MANQYILERLEGILNILSASHAAGTSLSSATKGRERETFVNTFLKDALPPPYRFGSGDITDSFGRKSGQLDIVIESPLFPSLPLSSGNERLYIAESIAAVVEVKSNLVNQWAEVQSTSARLKLLRRDYSQRTSSGSSLPQELEERIPLFAVGYEGWSNIETVRRKLLESDVDGILIINKKLFLAKDHYNGIMALDARALWGLLCCLHLAATVTSVSPEALIRYARD